MQHLGIGITAAPQPPFDAKHAANVAQHDGIGSRVDDICALLIGDACRYVAELDREGATEPAALFGIAHLPECEARDFGRKRRWLKLHPELTQPGAAVVVGDRPLKRSRHPLYGEYVH